MKLNILFNYKLKVKFWMNKWSRPQTLLVLIYQASTLDWKVLMEPCFSSLGISRMHSCNSTSSLAIVWKWPTRFDNRCLSSTHKAISNPSRYALTQSTVDCVKSNVNQESRNLLKVYSILEWTFKICPEQFFYKKVLI